MTRIHMWLVGSAATVILSAVLSNVPPISAQQPPCADRARRVLAVNLARQINSAQSNSRAGYQPLSAFSDIVPPQGFTVQFIHSPSGYVFSVKDNMDACRLTVFSDQE